MLQRKNAPAGIEEYKILCRHENKSMFGGQAHARQPHSQGKHNMKREQPRANKHAENNANILVAPVEEESAMILRRPSSRLTGQALHPRQPGKKRTSTKTKKCSENKSSHAASKRAEAARSFSKSSHRPLEQRQQCCIGRGMASPFLGLTFRPTQDGSKMSRFPAQKSNPPARRCFGMTSMER